MRILFIVPYVPDQIRVRPYNLIRYLARRQHQITLVTLQTSAAEAAAIAKMEGIVDSVVVLDLPRWRSLWNCLRVLPTPQPLQSVYCWQPEMRQVLSGLAIGDNGDTPYDVIHVEHLRGVRYGLDLKKQGTTIPVVWDSVDCISYLFEQAVAQGKGSVGAITRKLDLNRTQRFEGKMVDAFDQLLVTSPADRDAFLKLRPAHMSGEPPISILPNGVDLDTFKPDPAVERDPATIIVSGKMSYHANISMVLHLYENIMPLVWRQVEGAKLQIVGKDPAAAVKKLAADPRVTVTGTVPAIEPYLQKATLAVAPIPYGAGIQNKVLEAMACATPVVSAATAAKALTAVLDQDLLVAESAAEFAAKIVFLLQNPREREKIGRQARHYVETNHDWHQIAQRLEELYRSLLIFTPE